MNVTIENTRNTPFKSSIRRIIQDYDMITVLIYITGFESRMIEIEENYSEKIATLKVNDGHRSYTNMKNQPLSRSFQILLTNHLCNKWRKFYEFGHFTKFMDTDHSFVQKTFIFQTSKSLGKDEKSQLARRLSRIIHERNKYKKIITTLNFTLQLKNCTLTNISWNLMISLRKLFRNNIRINLKKINFKEFKIPKTFFDPAIYLFNLSFNLVVELETVCSLSQWVTRHDVCH